MAPSNPPGNRTSLFLKCSTDFYTAGEQQRIPPSKLKFSLLRAHDHLKLPRRHSGWCPQGPVLHAAMRGSHSPGRVQWSSTACERLMGSPGRGTRPLERRRKLQALEDVTCPFMGPAPLEPTNPRGFLISGTYGEEDVEMTSSSKAKGQKCSRFSWGEK